MVGSKGAGSKAVGEASCRSVAEEEEDDEVPEELDDALFPASVSHRDIVGK